MRHGWDAIVSVFVLRIESALEIEARRAERRLADEYDASASAW